MFKHKEGLCLIGREREYYDNFIIISGLFQYELLGCLNGSQAMLLMSSYKCLILIIFYSEIYGLLGQLKYFWYGTKEVETDT